MNVSDLLKQLAATQPDLVKDLVPSEGSQAYVLYRGKRYEGTISELRSYHGKWYGLLRSDGAYAAFFSGTIPIGMAQNADFVFDPEAGTFRAVLDDRVPCTGDKAYTRYHGTEYVGVLRMQGAHTHMHIGFIEPEKPDVSWGWHEASHTRGLQVGYDEKIVWDEERGMYRAPADHD